MKRREHPETACNAHATTVPVASYGNNQHAENKNVCVDNLWNGNETRAALTLLKWR